MTSDAKAPGTFEILHQDAHSAARLGRLWTKHGPIDTPVFMPVGTQATVKAVEPRDLLEINAQVILGNTYHLHLRPGPEIIAKAGGLHSFMSWDRPILTDSGGFQVFSLGDLRKITPQGVSFRSHHDGSQVFIGPKESMATQRMLGSDIAMLFDECMPYPCDRAYAERSVAQTLAWEATSLEQPRAEGQLRFGIVQGGSFADLRMHCAKELAAMPCEGYAVGGVSVGEPESEMYPAVEHSVRYLPQEKPRYVMGLGDLVQISECVALGADMFDCVCPTRVARHGTAYTRHGQYPVKAGRWKEDFRPVEEGCDCYCCRNFSRAYVRHLIHEKEILGIRLLTLHNLHWYLRFMTEMREAIANDCFVQWRAEQQAKLRGTQIV